MSIIKWFRVCSRPEGRNGPWTYGWVFPSDSLPRAEKTIQQVCHARDKEPCEYWVKEVDPGDFDHPECNIGRE
jgi:hypothetical protein